MSGAAFEGLVGLPTAGDESYAPGSPGFDPLLVREVMELYMQGPDQAAFLDEMWSTLKTSASQMDSAPAAAGYIAFVIAATRPGWDFGDARERISTILGRGKERVTHADGFIAAAIDLLADANGSGDEPYQKDIFIDALVQALYDHGHNDFRIDLRCLAGSEEKISAGCRLQGREGAPLQASYAGESLSLFGFEVSNCELKLEGQAEFAGHDSEHSALFLGGVLGVMTYGSGSKQCRFYMKSHPEMIVLSEDSWGNEFHITPEEDPAKTCMMKFASDEVLAGLKKSGFFERGNRLYFHYPDRTTEVLP